MGERNRNEHPWREPRGLPSPESSGDSLVFFTLQRRPTVAGKQFVAFGVPAERPSVADYFFLSSLLEKAGARTIAT